MDSIYHVEKGVPQDIRFISQALSSGPNRQPELIHRLSHYIVNPAENRFVKHGVDYAVRTIFNAIFSKDGVDTRVWPIQEETIPDFLVKEVDEGADVIGSIAIRQAGSPEVDIERRDAVLTLLQDILQLRAAFGIEDVIIKRQEQQKNQ